MDRIPIGNRTFEYWLVPRADTGFYGLTVADEEDQEICDIAISVLDDGRVSVELFQSQVNQAVTVFEPKIDTNAIMQLLDEVVGIMNEFPLELQDLIESHPEIDVLLEHYHNNALNYRDCDRLDRLVDMVGAAQKLQRTLY